MKIVRKSNYNHEDSRGNQYFVELVVRNSAGTKPRTMNKREAKAIADCLNELAGMRSDDFYDVVADDYVLPPDWEP